ncbi:hypothetical protein HYALB_00008289 [Hymenoscyphus albidus]|uniref:Carboxylic ester hydrolase n=1 Tax=Hymenoscyphus albidus TaxID=595503 RepID=A0A9N9LB65_9HELO|nr:hypothetical protein HYALB_00008289 [Hymenoscyphus albidus]
MHIKYKLDLKPSPNFLLHPSLLLSSYPPPPPHHSLQVPQGTSIRFNCDHFSWFFAHNIMKYQQSFNVVAAALAATVSAAPFTPRHLNWTVGQEVPTTSGMVAGHAAPDVPEVSEYLGIPYAMPPVGSLRWQPPVAFSGSNETIDATKFGASCMQAPFVIPPPVPIVDNPESEDCLTLNVWGKPQKGERAKAVLVWVYGGAYSSGTSADPAFSGRFIADSEDVIVVSMNYRLNVFGYPGNPALPGNLGLRDVRLAMEWVRDNVEHFGGDPSRITLFGQSAGSGNVDAYSYAYEEDPIASGFILMSATLYGFPALEPAVVAERWYHITNLVGCGNETTSTAEEVSDCMMTKTTEEVLAGYDPANLPAVNPYAPMIDDDVVFSSYVDRNVAKAGYLIGNTWNEAGLFKAAMPPQTDEYWATEFNARLYTCAGAVRIDQAQAQGNPAWRYLYFGDFPNLAVSIDPPSGAYHTADLAPLFNTVSQEKGPSTPEEIAVGDYLRDVWSSFAKNPQSGLDSFWPQYADDTMSMAQTGFNNQTMVLTQGDTYDDVCHWDYTAVGQSTPL